MGTLLAEVAVFWHKVVQREKEIELLRIGDEYRRAIGAYYENSPGGVKTYPRNLEDLLLDKRFPFVRRYLRKIYADPMTGKRDWGLVRGSADGITGVYSLFSGIPLKQANFARDDAAFSGKQAYSDWKFAYAAGSPVAVADQAANAGPAAPKLPPEYAPPAVPPLAGNDPKSRQKYYCDLLHATDIMACGNMLQKFGDAAGKYCLSTAAARYAECPAGAVTTALGMTYQ